MAYRYYESDPPPHNGYYTHNLSSTPYSNGPAYIPRPPPYSSSSYSLQPDYRYSQTHRPSRSPGRQLRTRRSWPPRPYCEDASDTHEIHDPPARGEIDQHPILYDSELSPSEALSDAVTKKEKERSKSRERGRQHERNDERRFVLLPSDTTQSPVKEDPLERSESSRDVSPPPPIHRRRSRQELPSLRTDLDAAERPPPLERKPSSYSYRPHIKEDIWTPNPSTPSFLSPSASALPKGPSSRGGEGYFDAASAAVGGAAAAAAYALPKKYGGSRPSTPAGSGSSRPSTPNPDKPPLARKETWLSADEYERRRQAEKRGEKPRQRPAGARPERREEDRDRDQRRRYDERRRHGGSSLESSDFEESGTGSNSADSDRYRVREERRRRERERERQRHGDSLLPEASSRSAHQRSSSRSDMPSPGEFGKPEKRFTSPLPSPSVAGPGHFDKRRTETYPPVLGNDLRTPTSRPSSPLPYGNSTMKMPSLKAAQDMAPLGPRPLAGSTASSTASSTPPLAMPIRPPGTPATWQPTNPPKPPSHLDPPSHKTSIPPLRPCPRTKPVAGKHDWLGLPRTTLTICPSCYSAAIEPTQHRASIVPLPFRASTEEIGCDFGGQPWYRIAWLALNRRGDKDLSLLHEVNKVLESTPPCMGGYEAVRKWYSVVDPRTNQLVPGFDVCSACVGVVEAILPQLAGGVFVPKEDFGYPRGERRMCDLRFDTERFVQYFDALESMAEQTPRYLGRYIPHTDPFVDVVRSLASSAIAKCEKDREVRNGRWYVISQLPELTVCKSCFTQVIKLEAERGGRAIPRMFEVELRPIGSCQLYSDRMRDIFREAVKNDDFVLLARKARERKEKELEYREDLEAAKGYRGERREEEETIAERRWRRWE